MGCSIEEANHFETCISLTSKHCANMKLQNLLFYLLDAYRGSIHCLLSNELMPVIPKGLG